MPILRAESKLIYFAHVPKCGGSAVEHYLRARFGPLGFVDSRFFTRPEAIRWTKSSPQHLPLDALAALFPDGFFDHSFSIVRHPVARIVSAYHFQLEHERRLAARIGFSDWLADLPQILEEEPFAFDNHIRPMVDLVPEGAHVVHLEHGIEGLIAWFDEITGRRAAPRAIPWVNEQSDRKTEKVVPTPADLARIAEIYAADFERFGYVPQDPAPRVPAPELSDELLAAREAERARHGHPLARLKRQARRALKPALK